MPLLSLSLNTPAKPGSAPLRPTFGAKLEAHEPMQLSMLLKSKAPDLQETLGEPVNPELCRVVRSGYPKNMFQRLCQRFENWQDRKRLAQSRKALEKKAAENPSSQPGPRYQIHWFKYQSFRSMIDWAKSLNAETTPSGQPRYETVRSVYGERGFDVLALEKLS